MLNAETLKTVIFDLDGTLRHGVPHGETVLLEFAARLGAPGDDEARRAARQWAHAYWAQSENLLLDARNYGRENGEFWENYARRQLVALGVENGQALEWAPLLHQHMMENYNPIDTIPPDVAPTLVALRRAGLVLGLVTNRAEPVGEYLEEIGLAEYFDFVFAAGEIGYWKPQPEIFYHALGLANAKPQEAVYIGDNYYADVEGARAAQIEAILIDPDGIFPDAQAPVVGTIGELQGMLLPKRALS